MKENGGYLISFNGGQIVDLATNETIFHQGFDRKDIELLYNEAMEMGMSFISVSYTHLFIDFYKYY